MKLNAALISLSLLAIFLGGCTSPIINNPVCGDTICEPPIENQQTCPKDCGGGTTRPANDEKPQSLEEQAKNLAATSANTCRAGYMCFTSGAGNWTSALVDSSCQVKKLTPCQNGCNEKTGQCNEQKPPEGTVGNESAYQIVPNSHNCIGPGLDAPLYEKGSITYKDSSMPWILSQGAGDYCENDREVTKYVCVNGQAAKVKKVCPNGCKNNICVQVPSICEGYAEAVLKSKESKTQITKQSITKSSLPQTSETEAKAAKLTNEILETFSTTAIRNNEFLNKILERKRIMLQLAQQNPKAFIQNSITEKAPSNLDSSIAKELEKQISVTGYFEVWESPHVEVDEKDIENNGGYNYYLKTENKTYTLKYLDESKAPTISGERVQIRGIALENFIIVQSTEKKNIALKGGTTKLQNDNIGEEKIIVAYSHPPRTPQAFMDRLEQVMSEVDKYLQEVSYGQIQRVEVLTLGPYEMKNEELWDDKIISILDKELGVNLKQYTTIISIDERNCYGCAAIGKIRITGDNIGQHRVRKIELNPMSYKRSEKLGATAEQVDKTKLSVIIHEFGHGFGVRHSIATGEKNSTGCMIGTYYSNAYYEKCQQEGGFFMALDPMGPSNVVGHYNAGHKETFGWLNGRVTTVTSDGIYTINALEKSGGVVALKIPIKPAELSGPLNYYLQYMTSTGYDKDFGAELDGYNEGPDKRITDAYEGPVLYVKGYDEINLYGGFLDSFLVRFPPYDYSITRKFAIPVSKTFFDLKRNIAIKTLSKTKDSVTVQIALDIKCG